MDVKSHVHFVGILGSGMLPLAKMIAERGYTVSGTDRRASEDGKGAHGMHVTEHGVIPGHAPDLVVYSLACDESNAQLVYAREKGIPTVSRAQLLGALMSESSVRISVSGSHGKSTTTALIDMMLCAAGECPSTVSGATLFDGVTYRVGDGEIFVAEACEYKDSFLRLFPTHQLISGVELDHTDYFTDEEHIRRSFLSAAKRADTVIINISDRVARSIKDELKTDTEYQGRIITYGTDENADYTLQDVSVSGRVTRFCVRGPRGKIRLETSLIGEFNLMNVLAAVSLLDSLGVDSHTMARAVSDFRGIDRRMSLIGEVGSVPIYYDYAHHPTEIGVTIDALKDRFDSVTVIFRPHTYSRTKSLWHEFIVELSKANFTILLEIYPAREKAVEGVTAKKLADEIGERAVYSSMENAAKLALSQESDVIVLLGASDVDIVKREFEELSDK